MLNQKKGFAPIILIFILVGAAVLGGGAVLYKNIQKNQAAKTVTHQGLEELKELTRTVKSGESPQPKPPTAEERTEYEQKKAEIVTEMKTIAEDASEPTWDDLDMFFEHAEDLQQFGNESEADQMMDRIRGKVVEMLRRDMAKDICNVTFDEIKKMLQHAELVMKAGADVEGLMEWLGDALQQLAAERVDSWPAQWPPEFNIDFIEDFDIEPDEVVEKIEGVECNSGAACERLDFMELAGLFGNKELMDDILTGAFERIKSRQKEDCKKGCCQANGEVNEGVLKNVCLRNAGALWKEGRCQSGYRAHLVGKGSGEGLLGPMFGPQTGAFQKFIGADMKVDISGVIDVSTCDKSVYSTWKGRMVMVTTTSNKQLGTETSTKEDEIEIPFNQSGVFEGKIDVFLANLGFSAKVDEGNMSFTYDFGGTMPTLTMKGKVEKGKAVCDAVDQ